MPFRPPECTAASLNSSGQRILTPAKALVRYKASRVPENGWTDEAFRTNNGRSLIRDLAIAQRVSAAAGMRRLAPLLARWFNQFIDEVIDEFTKKFNNRYGRSAGAAQAKQLRDITIDPGAHSAMWGAAIEQVLKEKQLDFVSINQSAIQSTVDSAHSATINLLGGVPDRGVRARLNTRVRDLSRQVVGINDTTRAQLNRILNKGIDDGLTVAEMAKTMRKKFKQFSRSRVSTIARTEMGQAADAGRAQGLKDSGVVLEVSVIGCEAREPNSPQYRGESTCNIKGVPVQDVDKLRFHPNHTGTIVPSKFQTEAELPTPPASRDPIAEPGATPEPPPVAPKPSPEIDPTAGHAPVIAPKLDSALNELDLQKGLDRAKKRLLSGEGVYAEQARQLGITEEELLNRMDGQLQEILSKENTVMATRVDNAILDQVLDDGRFKNQFETQTSRGTLNNVFRVRSESDMYGIAKDINPENRPIYGYAAQRDDVFLSNGKTGELSHLGQYGGNVVVFKDEIRARSTWTGDDSLGASNVTAASPVNLPSGLSMRNSTISSGASRGAIKLTVDTASILESDSLATVGDLLTRYFETQYWGGVSVDDIAEVVFSSRPTSALSDKLKDAGIKWRMR